MKKVIGSNLKALRERTGDTMEQVARMVGIERSAYANYESGMREMPLRLLEKAADYFGVDLAMLFENDNRAVENMLLTAFRVDDLDDNDVVSGRFRAHCGESSCVLARFSAVRASSASAMVAASA